MEPKKKKKMKMRKKKKRKTEKGTICLRLSYIPKISCYRAVILSCTLVLYKLTSVMHICIVMFVYVYFCLLQ